LGRPKQNEYKLNKYLNGEGQNEVMTCKDENENATMACKMKEK